MDLVVCDVRKLHGSKTDKDTFIVIQFSFNYFTWLGDFFKKLISPAKCKAKRSITWQRSHIKKAISLMYGRCHRFYSITSTMLVKKVVWNEGTWDSLRLNFKDTQGLSSQVDWAYGEEKAKMKTHAIFPIRFPVTEPKTEFSWNMVRLMYNVIPGFSLPGKGCSFTANHIETLCNVTRDGSWAVLCCLVTEVPISIVLYFPFPPPDTGSLV